MARVRADSSVAGDRPHGAFLSSHSPVPLLAIHAGCMLLSLFILAVCSILSCVCALCGQAPGGGNMFATKLRALEYPAVDAFDITSKCSAGINEREEAGDSLSSSFWFCFPRLMF